jgi:hypothetical protein
MDGCGKHGVLKTDESTRPVVFQGGQAFYNASEMLQCGHLTALDCHCYFPHTLFGSPFPDSVSGVMARTATANGWPAALWLTTEQAARFGAELDPARRTDTSPLWLSEMTPGRLCAFYCASQFLRSDELLPTLRELHMLASGVRIAPAKMAGFPHLAQDPSGAVAAWHDFKPMLVVRAGQQLQRVAANDGDKLRMAAILSNDLCPTFTRPNHFSRETTSGMAIVIQQSSLRPEKRLLVSTSSLKDSGAMALIMARKFVHAGLNAQFPPWNEAGRTLARHALLHGFSNRHYFPAYMVKECGLELLPEAVPAILLQKFSKINASLAIPDQHPRYCDQAAEEVQYYNVEQMVDKDLAMRIAEYKPVNYVYENFRNQQRVILKIAAAKLGCLGERMWISKSLLLSHEGLGLSRLRPSVNVSRTEARNRNQWFNLSECDNSQDVLKIIRSLPAQSKTRRSVVHLLHRRQKLRKRKCNSWSSVALTV